MATGRTTLLAMALLALAACGGGDDDDATPEPAAVDEADGSEVTDEADGSADSGAATNGDADAPTGSPAPVAREITQRQPSGQAYVAVDGQEFTLTNGGIVDCTVSDEAITFGFLLGDNEVTLAGGANNTDGQWFGDIRVTVANVDGQQGPSGYFPKDLTANSGLLVIDGDSAEYAGPMQWQPPNDGSNPPAIDIGDGIISVTC